MSTLTDLIIHFGDLIELSFPKWDVDAAKRALDEHPGWTQYNPRKPHINRQGLSVTSLDGGYSGVPDLDSLREYNAENGTFWSEQHFNKRTPIVDQIPELKLLLDSWPAASLGRCHFLRLGAGGFFPPHRDNGAKSAQPQVYRILVPLADFDGIGQNVWLQEGQPVSLKAGVSYFLNTTKIHSLFSFSGDCILLVMNVIVSDQSINRVLHFSKIL